MLGGTRPEAVGLECISLGVHKLTVVGLDAPLGERTVVDGWSGLVVPERMPLIVD